MNTDYLRRQTLITQQNPSVVMRTIAARNENNEQNNSRIISSRISRLTQLTVPRGNEYYPQDHLPPIGPEASQGYYLTAVEQDDGQRRAFSIITSVYSTKDEQDHDSIRLNKLTLNILFVLEPILCGIILFPLIVLFWECGWNILTIILIYRNEQNQTIPIREITIDEEPSYRWNLLLFPLLIVQIILFIFYFFQNQIYNFLKNQNILIGNVLIKFHILILSSVYIIQWKIYWSIYDEYFPSSLASQIVVSITSLFALIIFNGHLADLVCSPFLFSYDSIKYTIHFGCPLLTKEMKEWKINLINHVLYEIINSNLSIITWRGFYYLVDNYILPDDLNRSIGITLLIGYLLYFIFMYFQKHFEELNIKYEFWTFISINFPQFYRNIRHFSAFIGCVFIWRGYWVVFDTYITIFDSPILNYVLFYMLSFIVLSIIGTSSSINGPLSSMNDPNGFFPLYPHCYISTVHRKFYRLFYPKEKPKVESYQF